MLDLLVVTSPTPVLQPTQVSRLRALLLQMWQKQGSGVNLGAQTTPERAYRRSTDGLPQLQAELEAMQRSLKSL